MVECVWGILGAIEQVFCRAVVQLSEAGGILLVGRGGRSEKGDSMLEAVFWTVALIAAWVPWFVVVAAEMG